MNKKCLKKKDNFYEILVLYVLVCFCLLVIATGVLFLYETIFVNYINVKMKFNIIPGELWHNIMLNVDVKDIVAFSSTSKEIRKFIHHDNLLWKQKFQETYPRLFKDSTLYCNKNTVNWFTEYKFVSNLIVRVLYSLKYLERRTVYMPELFEELYYSEIRPFEKHLINNRNLTEKVTYIYLSHILKDVLHNSSDKLISLTMKYYGLRVLQHFHHEILFQEWEKKFLTHDDVFEDYLIFFSQWFFPEIDCSEEKLHEEIDKMVLDVKEILRKKTNGMHPIFGITSKVLERWKKQSLSENQFSGKQSKEIISAVTEYLFDIKLYNQDMNFNLKINLENDFRSRDRDVVPRASVNSLYLNIICQTILRRLGIKSEIIGFHYTNDNNMFVKVNNEFLLGWSETWLKRSFFEFANEIRPQYFLNMSDKGQLELSSSVLPNNIIYCNNFINFKENVNLAVSLRNPRNLFEYICTSLKSITILLTNKYERYCCTKLLIYLKPSDINNYITIAGYCKNNSVTMEPPPTICKKFREHVKVNDNIFYFELEQLFLNYHTSISFQKRPELNWTIKRKNRFPSVKYAVGMIMKNLEDDYNCVIYNWHDKNKEEYSSIRDIFLYDLIFKKCRLNQPFYNVIVEPTDLFQSNYAVVAQENLVPVSVDTEIKQFNVGRFFTYWKGKYYETNETTKRIYPDDEKAVLNFMKSST